MKPVVLEEHLFEGVISFRRGEGWLQPLRLEVAEIPLHAETFVERALTAGGCRLRFATDALILRLTVEPDADGEARRFDLTTDEALLETFVLPPGGSEVHFTSLPAGRKTLEIWLPTHHQVRLKQLETSAGARFGPAPDTRPRWTAYGSSITHCRTAHSPARTWPAVAARRRGFNLTSLGYGGNCHMEPLVAMMIRDRAADFISLKVGINMVGTITARDFFPLLTGMVKIIREKQPATPIAVVSPIISPPREENPGAGGMTLRMIRREVERAVGRLRGSGDGNVHYFSGLDLFGADLVADCLPDLLHPNGDGYEIMGRNFVAKVIDRLGLKPIVAGEPS